MFTYFIYIVYYIYIYIYRTVLCVHMLDVMNKYLEMKKIVYCYYCCCEECVCEYICVCVRVRVCVTVRARVCMCARV